MTKQDSPLERWEDHFRSKIAEGVGAEDPAHDLAHVDRVVSMAKRLAHFEKARLEVVVPAAWLHDLVIVPKDDPRRSQASRLSAEAARLYLQSIEYPASELDGIAHAIEAHSFSAKIEAQTTEAKVVQDADRLDGLGAIGIARCFATAGLLRRPFYSGEDPFCESREPDDQEFTLDHFYRKLFRVAETLQTESGRAEGKLRASSMESFLKDLRRELAVSGYKAEESGRDPA